MVTKRASNQQQARGVSGVLDNGKPVAPNGVVFTFRGSLRLPFRVPIPLVQTGRNLREREHFSENGQI